MVGMSYLARVFGLVTLAAVGGACAAGSEQPPTGAAATGEPSTGSGGNDSATTSDAASGGSASSNSSGTQATSSSGGPGSGGAGAGGPGSGGDGPGSGGAGGVGPGAGGAGGESSGSGGAGGGGGGGGAGPTSGIVTFFAVKAIGAFAAVRDQNGVYQTDDLGGTYASTRPALTMRNATAATGLVRGNSGTLLYTTFNGSAWLAPAPVGGAITTDDVPAIASALDGSAHGTFHGTDDKLYYSLFDGSGFDPDDDPVGGSGASQAFGPTPGSIAVVDGDPIVVQAGADGDVYVLARAGAGWAAPVQIAVTATDAVVTPAMSAIDPQNGGDALLVFAGADSKLYWSIRDGGWSAPAEIAGALSTDPPSLTATPDGAVVAFRGTNGGIYAALFDGSGWEAPDPVVPISTTTASSPALAPGAGDADAELAFVAASNGSVVHVRLQNGAFGEPTTVGGTGLIGVALAASP